MAAGVNKYNHPMITIQNIIFEYSFIATQNVSDILKRIFQTKRTVVDTYASNIIFIYIFMHTLRNEYSELKCFL